MSMGTPWFNVRKAAQVCAFFALKAQGQINVLKLIKLVYLADRRFMEKYDSTMLNDKLVSMPHGPVNSLTLNYVNGMLLDEEWDRFIADRERHMLAISGPQLAIDDLDELSAAELECLEETWSTFGHFDQFALREYTHQHCPEWEDPHGSSFPIPYARIFKFLGKTESAEELEEKVLSERQVAAHLSW
jgi:uncharacterized phage-associated protein